LDVLVQSFKSKRSKLFEGPVTYIDPKDYGCAGGCKKTVSSGWFVDTSSQKEIISFVSAMKSAPTIPESAKGNFVKGTTFMKNAKGASDYKSL